MLKILVTGSSGFVGQELINKLLSIGNVQLHLPIRSKKLYFKDNPNIKNYYIKDFNDVNFSKIFDLEIQVIIHLIAITHKLSKDKNTYYNTNLNITKKLINFSIIAKVNKFIFLSSIKVNGEKTLRDSPFNFFSPINPNNLYAKTKFLAEKKITEKFINTDIQYFIIRSPLIIGKNVKGNLFSLLRILSIGIPLPLKNINNLRSFVSLDNLIDLIIIGIFKDSVKGTFLISNEEDISTSQLIEIIQKTLNKKSLVFYLNKFFLTKILSFFGRSDLNDKLFESLIVDIDHTKKFFNWTPKKNLNISIEKMVRKFENSK